MQEIDRDASTIANAAARQVRDAALLARLRNNDSQALEALMRLYAPQLSTVAFSLLGRKDLVEDVVQDVFVLLWERRASLDIQDNVSGYLYRTTRNRALNVIRHERAQHTAENQPLLGGDMSASTRNDVEQALDEADLRAQVYAALRQVPPSPREVFLLRWEHELAYDEIATALGKTIPTVRELMYRATKRLARVFGRSS